MTSRRIPTEGIGGLPLPEGIDLVMIGPVPPRTIPRGRDPLRPWEGKLTAEALKLIAARVARGGKAAP